MIRKCVNTIKYGTAKARAIVLLSLLFGIGTVGAIVCAIVFRQILFIFAAVACVFVVITLAQTLVIQGGVVEDAKNAETQDTKRSKRTRPQDADKKVDHMKPPVFAKRKNEKLRMSRKNTTGTSGRNSKRRTQMRADRSRRTERNGWKNSRLLLLRRKLSQHTTGRRSRRRCISSRCGGSIV